RRRGRPPSARNGGGTPSRVASQRGQRCDVHLVLPLRVAARDLLPRPLARLVSGRAAEDRGERALDAARDFVQEVLGADALQEGRRLELDRVLEATVVGAERGVPRLLAHDAHAALAEARLGVALRAQEALRLGV